MGDTLPQALRKSEKKVPAISMGEIPATFLNVNLRQSGVRPSGKEKPAPVGPTGTAPHLTSAPPADGLSPFPLMARRPRCDFAAAAY
jgi:hypothetical protein